MKRKLIALILCLCLFAVPANAMSVQLQLGSTEVRTADRIEQKNEVAQVEAAPYTTQGRTMVPLRIIAESFGVQVEWNEPTVTLTKDDTRIELSIGSTQASVNGEAVTLDVAPELMGGRTFVPMRFIGESLGYTVQWVPSVECVVISDWKPILKTKYSTATMEDLYLYSSLMYSMGAEVDLGNAMELYYSAMLAGDYKKYFLGENDSFEGLDVLREFSNLSDLCMVPAQGVVALCAVNDTMWLFEEVYANEQFQAQLDAFALENPIEVTMTADEVDAEYISFVLELEAVFEAMTN